MPKATSEAPASPLHFRVGLACVSNIAQTKDAPMMLAMTRQVTRRRRLTPTLAARIKTASVCTIMHLLNCG